PSAASSRRCGRPALSRRGEPSREGVLLRPRAGPARRFAGAPRSLPRARIRMPGVRARARRVDPDLGRSLRAEEALALPGALARNPAAARRGVAEAAGAARVLLAAGPPRHRDRVALRARVGGPLGLPEQPGA